MTIMTMVLIIMGGLEAVNVNVKADFKVPRLRQVAPSNSGVSSYDSSTNFPGMIKNHTGDTYTPSNSGVSSYDSSTNFLEMIKNHTGHTYAPSNIVV